MWLTVLPVFWPVNCMSCGPPPPADGIAYMQVSTDSFLFKAAHAWQFPAFVICLGSSYLQRMLAKLPSLAAAAAVCPGFEDYVRYLPHPVSGLFGCVVGTTLPSRARMLAAVCLWHSSPSKAHLSGNERALFCGAGLAIVQQHQPKDSPCWLLASLVTHGPACNASVVQHARDTAGVAPSRCVTRRVHRPCTCSAAAFCLVPAAR